MILLPLKKGFVRATTFTTKSGKVVNRKAYTDKRIAKTHTSSNRVRSVWGKDETHQSALKRYLGKHHQLLEDAKETLKHHKALEHAKKNNQTHSEHGIKVDDHHHVIKHLHNLNEKLEDSSQRVMMHKNHTELAIQKRQDRNKSAREKSVSKKGTNKATPLKQVASTQSENDNPIFKKGDKLIYSRISNITKKPHIIKGIYKGGGVVETDEKINGSNTIPISKHWKLDKPTKGINSGVSDVDSEAIKKAAPGAIRRANRERQNYDDSFKDYDNRMEELAKHQPEWLKLEGQLILGVKGQSVAAIPNNGKKNSRIFTVFDTETRKEMIQLNKDEVRGWLIKNSKSRSEAMQGNKNAWKGGPDDKEIKKITKDVFGTQYFREDADGFDADLNTSEQKIIAKRIKKAGFEEDHSYNKFGNSTLITKNKYNGPNGWSLISTSTGIDTKKPHSVGLFHPSLNSIENSEKFKITMQSGTKEVLGEHVDLDQDIKGFIHQDIKNTVKYFVISEAKTGVAIGEAKTKKEALKNANKTIKDNGEELKKFINKNKVINPDKSDAEISANRSKGMKGNKNAYKGGPKDEKIAKVLKKELAESPTLKGMAISLNMLNKGQANLLGRDVKTPKEMAAVAQVFRDPRYETFRYVLTKKDKVVSHLAVTSKLPDRALIVPGKSGSTPSSSEWLKQHMDKHGADGYYLIHNHPSGDPAPSPQDHNITRKLSGGVSGFKGHIIINSNKYATVEVSGTHNILDINKEETDSILKSSMAHPLLGKLINGADVLASTSKDLQNSTKYFTLLGMDNKLKTRTVLEYPSSALKDTPEHRKAFETFLRKHTEETGANRFFLSGVDSGKEAARFTQKAMHHGVILDASFNDEKILSETSFLSLGMGEAFSSLPKVEVEGFLSEESEAEKHDNKSRSMLGNRNAWKGGPKEEPKKVKAVKSEALAKIVKWTPPQKEDIPKKKESPKASEIRRSWEKSRDEVLKTPSLENINIAVIKGKNWIDNLKSRNAHKSSILSEALSIAEMELKSLERHGTSKPILSVASNKKKVVAAPIDYSKIKVGREDYEEKKEARIDRLRERAGKAQDESQARYDKAGKIGERFYGGQPILVGHHSEKGARRDQARMHDNMGRSIKAGQKADRLEQRAVSAESNSSISSDDPAAVVQLKEKFDGLTKLQADMKQINAAFRKYKKNPVSLDKSGLSEAHKKIVREYAPKETWQSAVPFASYSLTNNNAKIKNTKNRLDEMVRRSEDETKTLYEKGDTKIVDNVEENRIQVHFPNKPDEATRKILKSHAFKWAPSVGVWQRKRTSNAIYSAKNFLIKDLEKYSSSLESSDFNPEDYLKRITGNKGIANINTTHVDKMLAGAYSVGSDQYSKVKEYIKDNREDLSSYVDYQSGKVEKGTPS